MARDPRAKLLLHLLWNLSYVIYLLSAEQIRIVMVLLTSVEKTIVARRIPLINMKLNL